MTKESMQSYFLKFYNDHKHFFNLIRIDSDTFFEYIEKANTHQKMRTVYRHFTKKNALDTIIILNEKWKLFPTEVWERLIILNPKTPEYQSMKPFITSFREVWITRPKIRGNE